MTELSLEDRVRMKRAYNIHMHHYGLDKWDPKLWEAMSNQYPPYECLMNGTAESANHFFQKGLTLAGANEPNGEISSKFYHWNEGVFDATGYNLTDITNKYLDYLGENI